MAATPRESWSQARKGKYLTSELPPIHDDRGPFASYRSQKL